MDVTRIYFSVAGEAEAEFTEKKSRFIGRIKPVASEAEAKAFVENVRAVHREASHHVYAYVIGAAGEIHRASDDGEPSGTAGRPVLEGIKQAGLHNVALVVTRYFGGTLLGAGGLTRAYGRAASLAIEQAKTVRCLPARLIGLHFGYEMIGHAENLLIACGARVRDKSYAEAVCYLAGIPESRLEKLQKELTEAANGAVSFQDMGERLYVQEEL